MTGFFPWVFFRVIVNTKLYCRENINDGMKLKREHKRLITGCMKKSIYAHRVENVVKFAIIRGEAVILV